MNDDLHSRLTVYDCKKRARKIAAFLGMMGVFSVVAWLFLQVLPSDRLGLKYI